MAYNIDIIGDIEGYWGVGFDLIQSQLDKAQGEDIEIRLHSAGGSVVEGFAIRNALQNHKGNVKIHVVGLAASIASLILTGANEVTIQKGAFVMIHNVKLWGMEPMTAEELKAEGRTIETMENEILEAYVQSAKANNKLINNSEEETWANFKKLVDAETWLTAQQAVDLGLASSVVEPSGAASTSNSFVNTLSNYINTPKEIKNKYMETEKQEEKISVGALQTLFNGLSNLFAFKNKEGAEAQPKEATEEAEKAPIIEQQKQNDSMTIEEMKTALESEGFNVSPQVEETTEEPTQDPTAEKIEAFEAQLKEIQTQIKAFESKFTKPTGGETPTPKAKTKTSPLEAIIQAQLNPSK